MPLTNGTYDVLKWFVLIVLPATAVLFQGLGELYGYGATEVVVSTLNLFTAFIGTILHISSKHFHGGNDDGNSGILA